MAAKLHFGAVVLLMLIIITSAPAVLCVAYFGQSSPAHDCCPSPAAPASSVPVCCVQSPAVTMQAVDVDRSATLVAIAPVADENDTTSVMNFIPPIVSSTESPGSSSVLRI